MALYPTVADHYDLHLALCQKLQRENPHYNWVGFYWMDDADQALHLGAYVGAETDHVRIPYGRGICGQVAESGETFVVPDVHGRRTITWPVRLKPKRRLWCPFTRTESWWDS